MALFRHTSGEQVRTIENSFDDNRLGLLADAGEGGWERVDETKAADTSKQSTTKPPKTEG